MEKQKIVVANFKINLVLKFEIDNWIKGFLKHKQGINAMTTQIILAPPILNTLNFIKEAKDLKNVSVGLQDAFWEGKGSFTGGVSASTLKSYNGEYLILGHSERKKYFGETEEIVASKLQNAGRIGLKSILCVGETAEEKNKEFTKQSLIRQLKIYLKNLSSGQLDRLLICYEPVWAISANNPVNPPTVDEIMTAKLIIRKFLVEQFGQKMIDKVKILYGGSVNQHNVEEICWEAGMDGVLVGKASLVPTELVGITKKIER